jgi:hypothetical protein
MPSAAFTPAIFEPADRPMLPMLTPPSPRPAQVYVRGSGTPILDEVSGNPLRKYLVEADAQRQLQHRIEGQIEDRLRELRVDAQVGGEAFSEASASDLRQFIRSVGVTKEPAIFLLDNGNIRARCLLGLDLEPNCLAQGTQVFHRDLDSRHVLRGRPLRERRRLKAACRGGQVRVIDDDTNIQRQLLDRLHMLSPLHSQQWSTRSSYDLKIRLEGQLSRMNSRLHDLFICPCMDLRTINIATSRGTV